MTRSFQTITNKRPLHLILLVALLILAAFLRLGSPGVVEFKRDEANLSQLALDLVRGRAFPLLGISSSVGLPNPPISVYIFSIPYALSSDPTIATQFVGVLNVLAVFLTYALTRRYYGVFPALLAALLYAVSPWAVIYSRKIWAQDLLPPFVLATLLAGLIGFVDGRRWAQWLCLPLLAITAQIHYSALLLVIPVIYLIWIGRSRLQRPFFFSMILAVLVTTPFMLGVLRADLPTVDELRALTGSHAGETRSLAVTDLMLRYAALTIAGTEIHSLAGPRAFQQYLDTVPNVYPLFGLIAWGVLFSVIGMLLRRWKVRDSRRPVDVLLLLWLIVPVAAFSITWTEPYPHYLILIIPVAYIVVAVGASDLWDGLGGRIVLRRVVFGLGGVILAVTLLFQVLLWFSLVGFLEKHYTPDGFGTPLQYLLPVRQAILSRQPTQVVAHLDGQFIGTNDDTSVWNVLLEDVPLVRFVDDDTRVYPADPVLSLSRTCDGNGLQYRLRTMEEGCYRLYEREPGSLSLSAYNPLPGAADTAFANGARVLAYRWSTAAESCLELVWSVTDQADRDYTFAVHFFNAGGHEIVNADGLSWRGQYWRPGDIVVRRFCLSRDQATPGSEIAGVNLGMYVYDGVNFHNIDLLDASGTPVGQALRIPFDS